MTGVYAADSPAACDDEDNAVDDNEDNAADWMMKNCRANTAAAGVGVAAGTADSDVLFSYLYRMDDDD